MSQTEIVVLQHVEPEGLGTIELALKQRRLTPRTVRIFAGEAVPTDVGDARGLIVMGGPMGVYEQDIFPHLRDELRLIESALEARLPILGVCLGSQLLAHALGATVKPGARKEIGWFPVRVEEEAKNDATWSQLPSSFAGFHWHGDVFDLPKDAMRLASTELTANQAFRYGENAYGILFHLEVTSQIVRNMCETFAEEARGAGADPRTIVANCEAHLSQLTRIGATVFNGWASQVR